MVTKLRYIYYFFVLVLVQVLILNQLSLSVYVNAFVYILFLLMLPVETNKYLVLLLGLFVGSCVDIFSSTLGLHASACVLVSFLRPFVLEAYSPHEGYETNKQLSIRNYGILWFVKYALTLIFFHHLWLFFFESFSFDNILFTLSKVCISTLVTLLVSLMFHLMLMSRK